MNTRYAAKALVSCEGQSFLFVAGKRGRWNLPGGGIDERETTRQALIREANEEVHRLSTFMTDPVEAFVVHGPTSSSEGVHRLAHWTVFSAVLLVPPTALSVAEGSEITDLAVFRPEQCMAHDNMSALARMAVDLATRQ